VVEATAALTIGAYLALNGKWNQTVQAPENT